MDNSPNLQLPYILAAQAQKHVTHNEAVRALDALVHLSVLDRSLATPPATPADGDRYLVAAGATGAWSGASGRIAAYQDGAWAFLTPKEGFIAWIADENVLLAFDGATWQSALGSGADITADTLGINATADTTNRLSLASPATLFNHEGAGHQLKINKATAADTASILVQTGFTGRAEIGTVGDDHLQVKVSADGMTWLTALLVDKTSGQVWLPYTATGVTSLLLNGDFQINQRLFAGGALAAGAYGFDRWKGGASGASCSVSGMIVTLTSGSLTQVIEVAQRGHATLAAQTVTVSVDALSGGNLTVTLGSQTGTITAGSGRRSTTLTLEVGDTGNIALTLAPVSAAVTFSRVRAELGRHASAWLAPSRDIELSACQRYYWRVGGVAFNPIGIGRFASTTQGEVYLQLPTEMRTIPTVSTNGVANFSFNGVVLTGLTLHAGFNQRRDFVGLLSTVGSAAGTPGDMAVLVSQPAPAGIIEFSAEL